MARKRVMFEIDGDSRVYGFTLNAIHSIPGIISDSIQITDAAQGEAHYRVERYAKGNGAQVFPFENDRTYISVFRVDTGKPLPAFVSWSGYGTASPDEAITYALAIIKAAEIAKQIDAEATSEAAEDEKE